MYFGIVKDIEDPLKLGRAKVKVFHVHDNISTNDLGWSNIAMPANVPAKSGIGSSVNLLIGTLVFGFFEDNMLQEFVCVGTLPTKTAGLHDNNVRVRAEADPNARDPKGTYEPASGYAPVYPYNNVMETESGHVKEYDDTPGAERIVERHKSGTQYEIQPNGSKNERIVRDNYTLVCGNDTLEVKGNVRIYVRGDANILVAKDLTTQVGGDMVADVKGNSESTITGNMTATVTGNMTAEITGTTSLTGVGDISITQSSLAQTAQTLTIKSEYTNDVGSTYSGIISLDGDVAITKNLSIEGITTTSNATDKLILDGHVHNENNVNQDRTGGPIN